MKGPLRRTRRSLIRLADTDDDDAIVVIDFQQLLGSDWLPVRHMDLGRIVNRWRSRSWSWWTRCRARVLVLDGSAHRQNRVCLIDCLLRVGEARGVVTHHVAPKRCNDDMTR